MNLPDKWSTFDHYAMLATNAWMDFLTYNRSKTKEYGNIFPDPEMISGWMHPNWSQEDRAENRRLLAIAYDAQDKALRMRPHRVHMKTARNRLRSFLEG